MGLMVKPMEKRSGGCRDMEEIDLLYREAGPDKRTERP